MGALHPVWQQQRARTLLVWHFPETSPKALEELLAVLRSHVNERTLEGARCAVRNWARTHFGIEPGVRDRRGDWLVEKMLAEGLQALKSRLPVLRSWRIGCLAGIPEVETPSPREKKDLLLRDLDVFLDPYAGSELADLPPHTEFASAINHAAALVPPGADPSTQTLDEYLALAKSHYHARTKELRRAGFAPVRRPPQADLHTKWFLRYQVNREPALAIATGPSLATARAVQLAVKRLANLLDLPVRTGANKKPPPKMSS